MKKRNLILQAAVAGLFCAVTLSANATGSASNAIGNSAQIATQAVTSTSIIGSGSITYTVSGSVPIGNYYIYVQLANGATFSSYGNTATTVAAGALVTSGGTAVVSAGQILAGNTSIVAFPVNVTAAMPANSTFTFKPLAPIATTGNGAIANAVAAAGTGALNATMSLGASASYSGSLTSIVSDEAAPATAPIATFVSGINTAALTSGSFGSTSTAPSAAFVGGSAEKALINVLGGATGVSLTGNVNVAAAGVGTELLDLGGFYFVDISTDNSTTTPPFGADASTTFNLVNDYAGGTIAATLTGPAGFFNVVGQTTTGTSVFLATAPACTGSVSVGTVATGGASVSFSYGTPTIGAASAGAVAGGVAASATASISGPFYVCMQAPTAGAGNAVQWVAGQPSITATLTAPTANAVAAISLASTPLYNLQSNGGSAYVREYIPAAVQGYTTYIRVINTGSVSANINAAIVSDTTGLTGIPGVVATGIPAGGAVTLSAAQVEAAIKTAGGVAPTGVLGAASGFRPRLFVSAPTTITVQSFIADANGNFSEVSGGNSGSINVGGVNYNPFNQ